MKTWVRFSGLYLNFGGQGLIQDWSGHIHAKDKICLIGRNGSGKSTLLKIIAQQQEIDKGELFYQPGVKIAYLRQHFQNPKKFLKALDYILDTAQEEYVAKGILDALKIPHDKAIESMSGGEQRKLSLAETLSQDADVVLLDEPTNHLDLNAILWLEDHLRTSSKSYVVISHDQQFLKMVSKKTWWVHQRSLLIHEKGYDDFERFQEDIEARLEKEKNVLNVKLKQEAHWLQRGVTARRKRNQGRLRKLYEMREEKKRLMEHVVKGITSFGFNGQSQGHVVIEALDITKSIDGKQIFKPITLRVMKGDRIGIIGANGAGKTTLAKVLLALEPCTSGHIKHSKTHQIVYLDQMQSHLNMDRTVLENLCDGQGDYVVVNGENKHAIGYLKDFLFDEYQIQGMTKILSGGEKNRLALAKALTRECDFLVLDEPTNDLDSDTFTLLTDLLAEFKGTVLLISHDRDFLDTVVTTILAIDEQGNVQEYLGGYTDYKKQREQEIKKETLKHDQNKGEKPRKENPQASKIVKKLSYNEKRAFETLPLVIQQLEQDIKSLEEKMSDQNYFITHQQNYLSDAQTLEELKTKLDQAETQWLELGDMIEGY